MTIEQNAKPPGEVHLSQKKEVRTPKEESVRFIGGELSEEQMDRTQYELAGFIADPDRYIDRGGAGSVHRLSGGVCFKAMEARRFSPNAHLMNLGNPVEFEAQFLANASRIDVRGARTCRCYGFYSSRRFEDPDILLMEELDAVNLQYVLNGTVDIPESFHADVFLEDYWDFLDELHRRGVVHGDVAPRNVMIDKKTGKPRIIDFGRSQYLSLEAKKRQEAIDKDVADYDLVYSAVEKKFNLA